MRDRTIYVAKTKELICVFVFAYAKKQFSHDEARIYLITAEEVLGHMKIKRNDSYLTFISFADAARDRPYHRGE